MDAIWGRCEGYAGAARFGAFIRAHAREPEAFYIAFRDETVERIQPGHRAPTAGAVLARRGASAGPLATILPRLSTGEPAWVAALRRALVTAGRNLGAAIERIDQGAPDRGRCAEGDRPVRLHERLSRERNGSSPASTDTRCSGGSTGSRGTPAAAEIDVLERWPGQLRRPGADRAGRRVSVGPGSAASDVQRGCGHPEPAHVDHRRCARDRSIASEP